MPGYAFVVYRFACGTTRAGPSQWKRPGRTSAHGRDGESEVCARALGERVTHVERAVQSDKFGENATWWRHRKRYPGNRKARILRSRDRRGRARGTGFPLGSPRRLPGATETTIPPFPAPVYERITAAFMAMITWLLAYLRLYNRAPITQLPG